MPWFVVFKYLHIVTMFFAVALAVSGELVLRRVATTLDPHAIRTTVERVQPLGTVASGLLALGIVFGVIAALTGQLNLFAPWLLLSYAAVAGAMVIAVRVTDPWVVRLGRAAAASAFDTRSEELRAVVEDRRAWWGTVALMALIALIVFMMVVKPFS